MTLVLLVGGAFGWPVAGAHAAPLDSANSAFRVPRSAFTIIAQSARPDFPNRITFALTAESDGGEIAGARLFYRPTSSEVSNLSVAEVRPGRRVELSHAVDMRARYLPPGLEIEYYWTLTDAAGGRFDTPPQRFLYQDTRFGWRTISAGQVTVRYYSGNDDFGQDLLDTANRTIGTLGGRFGLRGDRPMTIVVYGNNRDFAGSLPPNSAEWIGGQAHPDLGLIVTGIQPGSGAAGEIRRIIPHEVSHLLLHQATENPYGTAPHWLDEGLAVYAQETGDVTLKPLLDRAVKSGTLLPARALNSNFPLDPTQARLSYAESLSLVQFLIARYGDAKLGELLRAFKDELSYDEALKRVYGFDTDGLDREWKASLGYGGDKPAAAPGEGDGAGPLASTRREIPTASLLGVALPLVALVVIVAAGLLVRRRPSATTGGVPGATRN